MQGKGKKIMFVTGHLSGGGAEHVISILASGCADLGAEVVLVVLREGKISYPVSDKVNLIRIKNGTGKIRIISRIKQLRKLLKKEKPDAVIPFLPIVTLYTMIANIGLGIKMIVSERADPYTKTFAPGLSMKDRVGNFLMRRVRLFNLADWMVFQTPDAQQYYGIKRQKNSSIIPNPIDIHNLPERFEGERNKVIVAAGRFAEEKNFPMLIKGFKIFSKKHPEYSLVIYGDGYLRNEYIRLISEMELDDKVSLPGFIDDLPEKIYKAAAYVSTSNHEGISNSMLEALGMGVPTIVTDCPIGGSKIFVHTDENGVLIPMGAVDELALALDKIVVDNQYAEKISMNAIKIREKLSKEKICSKWLELI